MGNDECDEQQLLARMRADDTEAFRNIVDTYIDRITEFAASMVGSYDVADDVVQRVFVWLWEHREHVEIQGSFKSYLFRAVRNRVLDDRKADAVRLRYRTEVQSIAAQESIAIRSPEEAIITADLVQAALSLLPERRQQAIRLRLIDDLTHAEIADILGTSPDTASRLVSRAIGDLRKILIQVSD